MSSVHLHDLFSTALSHLAGDMPSSAVSVALEARLSSSSIETDLLWCNSLFSFAFFCIVCFVWFSYFISSMIFMPQEAMYLILSDVGS